MLNKEAQFIKDCRDPFFFIEKMWGIVPQPCYPEFEEVLKNLEPEKWKASFFGKEQADGQWQWRDFRLGKHITWQQSAVLEGVRQSVGKYGKISNKIALKTGNGIGKSCLAGWLIPWFLFSFPDSVVPCTAPTASQMNDVLWKEAISWINRMPKVYKKLFDVTSGYIRVTEAPESWYARARTSRKENPEAFSGIHAKYIMQVADEASGIPDIIFEYGEGIKTAPFWIFLMLSNPTRGIGYFKKAFDETSEWRKYTFDSRQSPIVDWGFVHEKMKNSGFDSDDFRRFVKGDFPKEDSMDNSGYVPLFTESEIEQAQINDGEIRYTIQGIDPAGEGHDKTAFVGRNAHIAKILAEEKKSTPKSVAARGCTFIAHHGMNPRNTVVDNFGEGADVATEMAKARQDVTPLNVGKKGEDAKYLNLRAELTWKLRKWIKSGGQLVRDKRWNELLNIRYRYNELGKMQIMGKEKMRKEGIPSPDFFDAFMLTFAIDETRKEEEPLPTEDQNDIF